MAIRHKEDFLFGKIVREMIRWIYQCSALNGLSNLSNRQTGCIENIFSTPIGPFKTITFIFCSPCQSQVYHAKTPGRKIRRELKSHITLYRKYGRLHRRDPERCSRSRSASHREMRSKPEHPDVPLSEPSGLREQR